MNFAKRQRDPARHVIGIGFVVLVHALVIWLLLTGLANKAIQVIKKPLNATIIEEIKLPPPPPPPPPPPKRIEPPKVQVPVQPYVPPPDIPPPVAPAEPVISAPTIVAPTEPVVIAPPPPVVAAPPAPPAPPAKPAVRQGVSCPVAEKPSFPREAVRARIERGKVDAILSIDEKGNVTDVRIVNSEPRNVFDRVVKDTLTSWKCSADGTKYQASVEINFALKDE
ncbi:MAG: energy transducer TonB [Casimicrobiaceae bacterium]